jgi:hypothetical protein
MQSAHPKPILNTSLPPHFRQIRLELAREPGHPEGDTSRPPPTIQSVSFTSHMSCSTGSVFTSKPRFRHISSITVFS